MNTKGKRYSIPSYKESKGMRGELIRQVVNYLQRLNEERENTKVNAVILTAHIYGVGTRCQNGLMLNLVLYVPEKDTFTPVCAEELYRRIEEWMPRRIEGKYIKVRSDTGNVFARYFRYESTCP